MKVNVFFGQIDVERELSRLGYRCIRICSSPRLLKFALDDFKRILLLNGYPMGTVKYHMNDVTEIYFLRLQIVHKCKTNGETLALTFVCIGQIF